MVTAPPPYSPRGIWPWKVAYSSGWSSVCTARWFCAGSSGTPFGSAQETSPPPRSSRKSQCSRRAWCSCTTKMPACPPVPSGSPSGTGSGVRAGSRLPRYSASRSTFPPLSPQPVHSWSVPRPGADLPAVVRGVRRVLDGIGVLGPLVHRLDRDAARAGEPYPDVPVAPARVPERETHVPRVLQVQVHSHRHVPVQQRTGLGEQRLARPQVADERVARGGQQQQARTVGGGEDVAVLAHRVMG